MCVGGVSVIIYDLSLYFLFFNLSHFYCCTFSFSFCCLSPCILNLSPSPSHISCCISSRPFICYVFFFFFPSYPYLFRTPNWCVFRSVRRSESLCVERCHSRRVGSTRGKQSRSRSDVDLQSTSTSQPSSPFSQPSSL